jgi:formylglycine-generating enzyme required for sulfatase activity
LEAPGDLTSVGSYPGSPSPYGTFDQGGNVLEWNEATFYDNGRRELRGGSFSRTATVLASASRLFRGPSYEGYDYGFRVAPEPSRDLLLVAGLAGVFGLAGWRRARA